MRPADTSPEAWAVQRALHRSLTGEQRLTLAFEMAEATRQVSEAGQEHRARQAPKR